MFRYVFERITSVVLSDVSVTAVSTSSGTTDSLPALSYKSRSGHRHERWCSVRSLFWQASTTTISPGSGSRDSASTARSRTVSSALLATTALDLTICCGWRPSPRRRPSKRTFPAQGETPQPAVGSLRTRCGSGGTWRAGASSTGRATTRPSCTMASMVEENLISV